MKCKHEYRFLRIDNKFKVSETEPFVMEVSGSVDLFYCVYCLKYKSTPPQSEEEKEK